MIFLLCSSQPWPSVSNLAKDFIDRVLTVDPSERLTAGQALKHPWIVSMAASSSMKNLQRCISQNLLKRASSRCQSTKSAQSTRSSRSSKSGRARRVREKELRELNRRYQQQYNGWRRKPAVKTDTDTRAPTRHVPIITYTIILQTGFKTESLSINTVSIKQPKIKYLGSKTIFDQNQIQKTHKENKTSDLLVCLL